MSSSRKPLRVRQDLVPLLDAWVKRKAKASQCPCCGSEQWSDWMLTNTKTTLDDTALHAYTQSCSNCGYIRSFMADKVFMIRPELSLHYYIELDIDSLIAVHVPPEPEGASVATTQTGASMWASGDSLRVAGLHVGQSQSLDPEALAALVNRFHKHLNGRGMGSVINEIAQDYARQLFAAAATGVQVTAKPTQATVHEAEQG